MANIGQNVDADAISINNLELKMSQLSSTVNTHQLGNLPSNTDQNRKNSRHCMVVTTRGGKQTSDPPMPSVVQDEVIKDNEVVKDMMSLYIKQ